MFMPNCFHYNPPCLSYLVCTHIGFVLFSVRIRSLKGLRCWCKISAIWKTTLFLQNALWNTQMCRQRYRVTLYRLWWLEAIEGKSLSACFPSLLLTQASWVKEGFHPPHDWPREGAIGFQCYGTRYRPGLDLVLKGIDLILNPNEKVSYKLYTACCFTILATMVLR